MKLGEKLQQLRKKSGLSQEQLAEQLTVSRQAVSKWELDETMPDTENVVQLSRIFDVSCDYLLLDEMAAQNAAQPGDRHSPPMNDWSGGASAGPGDRHSPPADDRSGGLRPPGETHLNEQGWEHNAFSLSIFVCAVGLLAALGGWLQWQTTAPLIIGLVVQLTGVMLFELAVPRMGENRTIIRLKFYKLAVWFLMPIPMYGTCWWMFDFAIRPYPSVFAFSAYISLDFSLSGILTAALTIKQLWLQRQASKK